MSQPGDVMAAHEPQLRDEHASGRRAISTRTRNRYISLVTGLTLLLVWEVVGRQINPLFSSYPSAIAVELWDMTQRGVLLDATIESLQAFLVGYLLAAAIGIPIGLLLGRSSIMEAAFGNYVVAAYTMPIIALIPLFILWFGLGFAVKVAIIFTMGVFPVIINTWDGVRAVPKTLIEVGTTFVASQAAIMRKIIMPATVPYMMTGLRLAVGRGIVAMVVAEFFTAVSGLGALIIVAGNNFNTAGVFGPVVVLMLLGVGLTQLVGMLERKVAPWQQSLAGRNEA